MHLSVRPVALVLACAIVVGFATPAFADLDDPGTVSEQGCVVVEPRQVSQYGVTVWLDRQTLCHAENLSSSGASVSISYGGGAGVGIDPREWVALVPGDGGGGFDAAEMYRHIIEDELGGDIYENTVCPDSSDYTAELDCYATDYLLGDYVRNALLQWADRVVPGGLPAPVRGLAESAIDRIVGVTNDPTGAAPNPPPAAPPVPALPLLP